MFPILRGRSGNPGTIERFYGEVDDVISAYEFLASQAHIDPKRIYLGGHSTGGKLALLVAGSTDRFAGIISLGPVEDDYGEENALYVWNEKERSLREPIRHLGSIKSPTFVVEGEFGNSDSLEALRKANKNPNVKITTIDGANHFDVIHPLNLLVASAIMESKDGKLDLSLDQLKTSYQVFSRQERESFDLQMLSELRGDGLDIDEVQAVNFYVVSDKTLAESFKNAAGKSGFSLAGSKKSETSEGQSYFVNRWEKQIQLSDLKALFEATATISGLAKEARLSYEGWSVEVK